MSNLEKNEFHQEEQIDDVAVQPNMQEDDQIIATPLEAGNETVLSMSELLKEQSMPAAILWGVLACIVGAAIWCVISVATGYQIGYMAIGMGFLVGYAIRVKGKGVTPVFGVLGAILALLGCVLGDVFSLIGMIAKAEGISYMETISLIDFSELMSLWAGELMSLTAVFYGIALYEGYKLSFRPVIVQEDNE